MSALKNIEDKLIQFTRKYYANELIKGTLLFFSLGLLYFLFILFIEYFLWLNSTARTLLFWLFVSVELYLLIRFILLPIGKLIGLKKGISSVTAAKIIGNHFPEVKDKLLNILQLKASTKDQSDLLLASIAQKSKELQPIPFAKAIDFSTNKKYLKYALLPVGIYAISLYTVSTDSLSDSFKRVVDYKTAYQPPAPFAFEVQNTSLTVIQGENITITVNTVGRILPEEVQIHFNNQNYYLEQNTPQSYQYTFTEISAPIQFYFTANNVQSDIYNLEVIQTPTINAIGLQLNYPKYTQRKDEFLANTTNVTIPEGTKLTWQVSTQQTDTVRFIQGNDIDYFIKKAPSAFEYSKQIKAALSYEITSSNQNLTNFETLKFSIDVVKDEFPVIAVRSNIDSISRGDAQFAGQLSDDYGLKKLQLVYYEVLQPKKTTKIDIEINRETIQTFFYEFPKSLSLKKGTDYELYFQVADNDAVNGSKWTKSAVFRYRQKTDEELKEELLQEQRNTIQNLENSLQNQQKNQKELEDIQQEFQSKKNINWNDKKKVDNFIQRQQQYKKMMQRQTEKLQDNLDEKIENDHSLQEKKEDLKERINELKKLEKQQKLLDEIQKMADKLNKEDLVQKAKELAQQNKQQQRSLEKTLEMVKRFYVEQKTMQIANKLEELSKKQEALSNKDKDSQQLQKAIKKDFEVIKKELDELAKDNEQLKEPMDLPEVEEDKQEIDKELNAAEKSLKQEKQQLAKQNQKQSAKKMRAMSAKMQKSMMDMQSESMEENMDDLRKILENLVIFSFEQEALMNTFSEISTVHPEFGKSLKDQNQIKKYFEHIDDSLYVLAMRVPKISSKIQDDLSTAHYNLDQSLENFTENRFNNALSNQRYVITAANNLADYLSAILNSMKNNMSMKMGKGKKGKGNGFSLPDLIKKQEGLSKKMQEGLEKGKQKGKGKKGDSEGKDQKGEGNNGKKSGGGEGDNEDLNGELYRIFKEQTQLRQALQDAIQEGKQGQTGNNLQARKALKSMEQLENEILEKGFSKATLQKMQSLNYELLKLKQADLQQGEDSKRKSNTNLKQNPANLKKALQFKKQFYNQIEILNRQSLPLRQNYKKKVRAYFSDANKVNND